MDTQYTRTEELIGSDNLKKLQNARVAVFGIGGVGGYAVEALARTGVGTIDLIDNDTVNITNLNRQIIAVHSTLGLLKTEVARKRIMDINPKIKVNTHNIFYNSETANQIELLNYDYIIDAIDTVTSKLELIVRCNELSIPIISCMGTGNKLFPTLLEVNDIFKTSVCPLARVMRQELKKRNIKHLKVVYSKEEPKKKAFDNDGNFARIPASATFVPATAGMILASEAVNYIIGR